MTWIDAVLVIVFMFFIITAFSAGFIRETIGTGVGDRSGAVLAGLFYDDVADTLLKGIDNETTSAVIAFMIIFFGVDDRGAGARDGRASGDHGAAARGLRPVARGGVRGR